MELFSQCMKYLSVEDTNTYCLSIEMQAVGPTLLVLYKAQVLLFKYA